MHDQAFSVLPRLDSRWPRRPGRAERCNHTVPEGSRTSRRVRVLRDRDWNRSGVGFATADVHQREVEAEPDPGSVAQVGVEPLVVELHVLEVLPDPLVVGAGVVAADAGPIGVDTTEPGGPVVVGAVAVGIVPDHVRETDVEADLAGIDLLSGQGEAELAAHRVADMHALGAVDLPGGLRGDAAVPEGEGGPRDPRWGGRRLPHLGCGRHIWRLGCGGGFGGTRLA